METVNSDNVGTKGGVKSGMKAGVEDGLSSVEALSRDIPVQMTADDNARKSLNKESAGEGFNFLN